MTKKDFISAVAKSGNMTKKDAEAATKAVIETIMSIMSQGDEVTFAGFGKFYAVHKEAEVRHNYLTNADTTVPAKYVPKVKFSTVFKKSLID